MAFTATVTPGKQFAENEAADNDKLNQLGTPTVALSGNLNDLGNLDAGSPSNGDALYYNDSTANWESGNGNTVGFGTGDIKATLASTTYRTTADDGWLDCDGNAVLRSGEGGFAALFAAIGTTYGVGDGSTTFNLPDLRGRVLAHDGTGVRKISFESGDVSAGNDTIVLPGDIPTGIAVKLYSDADTWSGVDFTGGTTYYTVRLSYDSALDETTIYLSHTTAGTEAVLIAAAVAAEAAPDADSTVINITTPSGGTYFYFTHKFTTRAVGDDFGWEFIALEKGQIPAHTHNYTYIFGGATTGLGSLAGAQTAATGSAGDSEKAINTQPTFAVRYLIKT